MMIEISQKQQYMLALLLKYGSLSSSRAHHELLRIGGGLSLVTIKRELSAMTVAGLAIASGKGRARTYGISALGRIFSRIDASAYCAVEPDKRYGLDRFNFDLLPALPSEFFTSDERAELEIATEAYHRRTADLPPAIEKKELERLIIELSWKSSKIEGNTYTLLDTEKLIVEHREAPGHDRSEAIMILNHKDAFTFVHGNAKEFRTLTRANLEKLHSILVNDLSVGLGLRQKPVGIVGSKYQPLDNLHQIREGVEALATAVSRMETPYGKALTALLGISYLQPFEDGNKRTGRLMANALLLAWRCAPLSYRSVEEKDYRAAMIVFYEINSMLPFKDIFVGQYKFAAKNYAVK
ncbi:MAG: Fic family protein [Candidatus Sungiibacteriota bacterium]